MGGEQIKSPSKMFMSSCLVPVIILHGESDFTSVMDV